MKTKFIVLSIVVALIVAGVVVRYGFKTKPDLENMTGRWTTTAPKYAESYITITAVTISFGSEDYDPGANWITKVKMVIRDEQALYSIYYEDAEKVENVFHFYYSASNGGIIRMENQSQIEWVRKSEDNY